MNSSSKQDESSLKSFISFKSFKSSGFPLISSLYHTSESFLGFCSLFLKENQIFGENYEEISHFLPDSSPKNEPFDVSKLLNWLNTFDDKIPNLDNLFFRILYIKILGMTLIFHVNLNYNEFEVFIEFFYKSLKFQKFNELKEEVSDILNIFLQNFLLILQEEKKMKTCYAAEFFIIKSLCFLIFHHFYDFSHDFVPIIIKSLYMINEYVCKDLLSEKEKDSEEFLLKKQNFLTIFMKSVKLFDFFLFKMEKTEEKNNENLEIYGFIFSSLNYLILLDNASFLNETYTKFSGITDIKSLFSIDISSKELEISYNILKKELIICSLNETNLLQEKDDLKFLKTLEIVFQVRHLSQ